MRDSIVSVFGMRRSGTTWVGKLFDSHPSTVYRHEPDSLIPIPDVPYYPDLQVLEGDEAALAEFFASVERSSQAHVVAKLPLFRKHYLNPLQFQMLRASAAMSKSLKRFVGVEQPVWNVLRRLPPSAGPLVWKSVEAPCRIGYFARSLPETRNVYVMRHPCGYLNSYIRGQDSGNMPATTDREFDIGMWERRLAAGPAVNHGLDIDVVSGWSRKERMMWEWVLDNEKALADIDGMGNVMLLNYDSLCLEPVAGTQEMFEFAGLDWNRQTEAFIGAGSERADARYFSVMKDPKIASNAWRTQLADEDKQLVKRIVSGSSLLNYYEDVREL